MLITNMISSSDKNNMILEFYQYCERVEKEWVDFFINKKPIDGWSNDRALLYHNGGVVWGLMRERDADILKCLNLEPDLEKLLFLIKRIISKDEEKQKQFLEEINYSEYEKQNIIKNVRKCRITALTKLNILEWIRCYNRYLLFNEAKLSYKQQLMFLEISQGYDYYKELQDELFRYEQPAIAALYNNKLLNDDNYTRYGLIPVHQERQLITITAPSRIYDKETDKTICLYVEPAVAQVLEVLKAKDLIGRYSFRGQNSSVHSGYNGKGLLFEETERGVHFSFNIKELCPVTKLYVADFYNDQLWINVDQKKMEIKFEELDDELHHKLLAGADTVVTRLVHLLYDFYEDGNVFVTHIDFEYLFYTQAEFEQRKTNPYIKGSARRRIKIFKVDNAIILMNYPCSAVKISDGNDVEVPFIYFMVYRCLKHRILIDEYFDKCFAFHSNTFA